LFPFFTLNVQDKYWTVELALPFHNLVDHSPTASAPPRNKDQWRINFSRLVYTSNLGMKNNFLSKFWWQILFWGIYSQSNKLLHCTSNRKKLRWNLIGNKAISIFSGQKPCTRIILSILQSFLHFLKSKDIILNICLK